jgi:hypothetical protein
LASAEVVEAWPSRACRPTSSEITVPPVRIAMSSQHGLAAIAEARRLDGDDLEDAADAC